MNEREKEGRAENLGGRIKEAAGTVTGSKEAEAEGAAERFKGAVKEKVGQAKRKIDEHTGDDDDT